MRSLSMLTRLPRLNLIVFLTGLLGIIVGTAGIGLSSDPSWIKFFDNVHWTSGTAAAAFLAWLGVKSSVHQENHGAARWFAVGLGGYALGQLIWDGQVVLEYRQFPSPSDFFYLWLGPCLTVGLFLEIRRNLRRMDWLAALLDVLSLSIASLTLVLVIYLPKQGDLDLLSMAVLVSYPVSLLVPTCIGLIMIPAMRLRVASSFTLFLIAIAVTAWSWMHWNTLALDGLAVNGAWFNVSFSIAILLAGLIISIWQLTYTSSPRCEQAYEAILRMLPIVSVIMACAAIIAAGVNA